MIWVQDFILQQIDTLICCWERDLMAIFALGGEEIGLGEEDWLSEDIILVNDVTLVT